MIFARVPLSEAQGAILVHGTRAAARRLRKGTILSAADLDALRRAGVGAVVVARLEAGDVEEDEAARRLAACVAGTGVRAGRARLGGWCSVRPRGRSPTRRAPTSSRTPTVG